jgi:hypothetical protein
MANKQETLGDAIEDEYYASAGVRTGTAYNEYLVSQRERSQFGIPGTILEQDRNEPYSSGPSYSSSAGYRLLPFMQRVLDYLPWWLNAIVAIVGGALGIGFGREIDPATNVGMWILGAAGFLVGFGFLRLVVVLIDFSLQLMKLAIVVAIIGGVIYGLVQLIGN